MCVRSFVTIRCVLTKPSAFFENGNNPNLNNCRSALGPFRVQKTPKQSFAMYFCKCGPIVIIVSLLPSELNGVRSCYVIYHLILNLFPHYLANFESLNIPLQQSCSIQKCVTSLIYSKYLPEMSCFSILRLCRLIYNITSLQRVFNVSVISTHACFD